MYPDLKDKVAVVTGGYKGLGRAVSLALAKAGSRVAIAARSQRACAALAGEIQAAGQVAIPECGSHPGQIR
ncbi:MAG: SDR family NAD(P)-dependent oxidoreductase [Acidimicrobiia bacterium]|nr:SDR family NAD(P)-dependent oxidoreductase [Acidimicrobiia bacterium]